MQWASMPLVSLLAFSCASLPSNELLVGGSLEPRERTGEEPGLTPAAEAYEVAAPSFSEALGAGFGTSAAGLALPEDPLPPHLRAPQDDVYYDHPHYTHHPDVGVRDDAYFDHPHSTHHVVADADDDRDDRTLHGSRFTLKAGLWDADDADELDDGWIALVSWMKFLSPLFALELEVGYLDADGEEAGNDADVWAVPIMVNGRVNLPIWVLDAYAGAGLGTFYYDVEVDGVLVDIDDDGFLFGGNAFVGASIGIAEAVALGLEGKYYVTEDADDFDEGLDAFALLLTLGFSR